MVLKGEARITWRGRWHCAGRTCGKILVCFQALRISLLSSRSLYKVKNNRSWIYLRKMSFSFGISVCFFSVKPQWRHSLPLRARYDKNVKWLDALRCSVCREMYSASKHYKLYFLCSHSKFSSDNKIRDITRHCELWLGWVGPFSFLTLCPKTR